MSDNKTNDIRSKLDAFTKEIQKTGKKVAHKTVKMADAASARIKLQSCSVKLSAEYETLGKLSYRKLVCDADNAEKIAASIERIDALKAEVEELKKELEEKLAKINETDN